MNAKQLKDEAMRLHLDAEAKRKLADRHMYNARDYGKAADTVKADTERVEATKLIDEASQEEQNAQRYEQGALEQEERAHAIDREQSALQSAHDQRMKELEAEKAKLRGGAGLFS